MYFILMLIGALIIFIGVKAPKKEKVSFKKLLHREEIDIDEIDIIIGELRMEFSSTILELQKDVMELNEKLDAFTSVYQQEASSIDISNIENQNHRKKELPINLISTEENFSVLDINYTKDIISPKVEAHMSENNSSSKISEISELFNKGFSIDEICEKVQMGRGEILLIKELYLK